jgi:hypothetical protein
MMQQVEKCAYLSYPQNAVRRERERERENLEGTTGGCQHRQGEVRARDDGHLLVPVFH